MMPQNRKQQRLAKAAQSAFGLSYTAALNLVRAGKIKENSDGSVMRVE